MIFAQIFISLKSKLAILFLAFFDIILSISISLFVSIYSYSIFCILISKYAPYHANAISTSPILNENEPN